MYTIGAPLTFRDKEIVVHFDAAIGDAHIVAGGIRHLVRRFQNLHKSDDELAAAIDCYVGNYCLATRLVRRTPAVIEFWVAFRQPFALDPSARPPRPAAVATAVSPVA
jgi:hypothetical protein